METVCLLNILRRGNATENFIIEVPQKILILPFSDAPLIMVFLKALCLLIFSEVLSLHSWRNKITSTMVELKDTIKEMNNLQAETTKYMSEDVEK